MIRAIRAEPVMFVALVNAVLVLLLAFGVSLQPEQIAAIVTVVELALAFVVRAAVVPVKSLEGVLEAESWRDMQARHEADAHRHIHAREVE